MMRINIHDAKTHLSGYLARMKEDDVILLCRRNTPVAEIRLLPKAAGDRPRRLGLAKGKVRIKSEFFEPLPDEIVAAFEGRQP
ncbi:MAG: type II toxin-antitoxin system Phd/YefM family antitoxin [Acidobacteriota bacterium]